MDYFKKPVNIFQFEMDLLELADKAFFELKNTSETLISKEDYVLWVKKYEELYMKIDGLYPAVTEYNKEGIGNPFKYVYYWLRELVNYLSYEAKAQNLLNEHQSLRKDLENDVLQWLVENEDFSFELFKYSWSCLDRECKIEGYLLFLKDYNIHILESDFDVLQGFQTTFDELYWGEISKYATEYEISENQSLKYYLKRAGFVFDLESE